MVVDRTRLRGTCRHVTESDIRESVHNEGIGEIRDSTMRTPAHTAIPALAALALLAGCAGPTPYQPREDGYGYTDQALESERYRVSFAGNSSTERPTVENYLLYRAAEVTLDRGYDHFIVVERDTERSTRYDSATTGVGGHHLGVGFGHRHVFGGFTTTTSRPREAYTAFVNILLRSGEKPADHPHAYDAREVVDKLGPIIVEPDDS